VDDFIDAAIADPEVNFSRDGKYKMNADQIAEMKRKLVQLASAATGGPEKLYLGKTMKEIHGPMKITDAEFNATLRHLKLALLRNNVQRKDVDAVMEAIEISRAVIVYKASDERTQVDDPKPSTLWERLGGEKQIQRLVGDFVDGVLADPKVNFSRDGKHKMDARQVAELKRTLVILASSVGGGPYKYDGKTMAEIHKGMRITDAEFDALVSQLRLALVRNEVKLADRFLIESALETTRKDIVEKKNDRPPMQPGATAP
jgi:hemoglobin